MDRDAMREARDFRAALNAKAREYVLPTHPCKDRCQYAIDVSMPEYSCANGCVYDKRPA